MTVSPATLLLFAKHPSPGQVKTRLCPPLESTQAAELYRAFLTDVAEAAARWAEDGAARSAILALAGQGPESNLPMSARQLPRVAQLGEGLGERMRNAIGEAIRSGADRIVLRNTDSPMLPSERIELAFELLSDPSIDIVFGPDLGGGYYLVGVRREHPELFEIGALGSWEEGQTVLGRSLSVARGAGLRVALLPEEADVDTKADLESLLHLLREDPDALPVATRAALTALRPV